MELRHKPSRKRTLTLSMAMWQRANVMWISLLIILLPNIKTSAQLMKIEYDPDKPFNVSKGLYDCTMERRFPLLQRAWSAMEVIAIQPQACLCCTQSSQCELCLQVWLKLQVTDEEDLGHDSGDKDDGDDEGSELETKTWAVDEDVGLPTSKETSDDPASLKLCYTIPNTLPQCYEVKCAVLAKQQPPNQCEMLGVVLKPKGLTPGITVHLTAEAIRKINATIIIPPKDRSAQPAGVGDSVAPPRVSTKVVEGEVQITVQNTRAQVGMCLKTESSGICKPFSNIPLYSVIPCMCIQAWWNNSGTERSESWPFKNINGTALENLKEVLHRNVLNNLTTSVKFTQTHSGLLALSWNVSAPCQVSVDVQLCHMGPAWRCQTMGNRQNISEGHKDWRMEKGLWRVSGAFVNINHHLPLCIKMKVMGEDIDPFCPHFSRRWHWSVPIVAIVLLFILIFLGIYSQKKTLEKWIQKWHSKSLIQGGRGHVLLLHPSCEDPSLSEMVCLLGSTLRSLGFSVSLDLWSHTELGSLGPVPWLHSQMDQLRSTGGHALVILSHAALEQAEEWSWQGRIGCPGRSQGGKDIGGGPAPSSPSSPLPTDVFRAALCCLLEDHQRGWAERRFSLVQFDSHSLYAPGEVAHNLPGLFQGLGMYSLPTQSQAFLDALMEHNRVTGRSWRWQSKWQSRWLSRALMKSQLGAEEHLVQILENSGETAPLQT